MHHVEVEIVPWRIGFCLYVTQQRAYSFLAKIKEGWSLTNGQRNSLVKKCVYAKRLQYQ